MPMVFGDPTMKSGEATRDHDVLEFGLRQMEVQVDDPRDGAERPKKIVHPVNMRLTLHNSARRTDRPSSSQG